MSATRAAQTAAAHRAPAAMCQYAVAPSTAPPWETTATEEGTPARPELEAGGDAARLRDAMSLLDRAFRGAA